jgi:hypothetical protein
MIPFQGPLAWRRSVVAPVWSAWVRRRRSSSRLVATSFIRAVSRSPFSSGVAMVRTVITAASAISTEATMIGSVTQIANCLTS